MRFIKSSLHNDYMPAVSADALSLAALAAAVYFFDFYTLSAAALAAAAHEAGHIICLKALGLRINAFRAEAQGFCIDYSGSAGAFGHALAAFAGPAAGLIYAYILSYLAGKTNSAWFALSAGISLLLSLFNLLPVFPLDGGRIFLCAANSFLGEKHGVRLTRAVSFILCILLFAAGVWMILEKRVWGLALTAAWLALSSDMQI